MLRSCDEQFYYFAFFFGIESGHLVNVKNWNTSQLGQLFLYILIY